MNLLILGEIRHDIAPPDFGGSFRAHMQSKRNPDVFAASASAWKLLETGLLSIDMEALPKVEFADHGKPRFTDCPLHFSLSHSGRLAAALISDSPCGVDVEIIRAETSEKLRRRVLSPEELSQDQDFFAVWTKKEAAAKLSGSGMPSRPSEMDMSAYEKLNRLQTALRDSHGQEYCLTALCEDPSPVIVRRHPEFPTGI